MPTKNEAFDDWTPELPELDGEEDEAATDELDHELSSFADDEADPLDDAAADDIFDAAAEIDWSESSDAADDDEREVDIGEVEIDADESESFMAADADEWKADDMGLDIDDEIASSDDDGGEEGMLDASETAIDEPLPDLDADEGDEVSEGLLLEGESSLVLDDERLPRWADVVWEPRSIETPLDEKGELFSLSMRDVDCAAITSRGELFVSRDGGESFDVIDAWRAEASAQGDELTQVAFAENGRMFLLTGSGKLLVRASREGKLVRAPQSGLLAMAAAKSGKVAAISADPGRGIELAESEDAGETWSARELEGPALVVASAPNPWLAATSGAVAMGSEAGLVVSRNGGALELVSGCAGTVAVAFAGDDESAPLVAAVYREAEDRTYIVRVSPEGMAEVVADLGGVEAEDEDEGQSLGCANALAWDAARKVLWVAGAFGLVALAA